MASWGVKTCPFFHVVSHCCAVGLRICLTAPTAIVIVAGPDEVDVDTLVPDEVWDNKVVGAAELLASVVLI